MYNNATLAGLPSQPPSHAPYNIYPKYNTKAWLAQTGSARFVACEGPRGGLLESDEEDLVWAYKGVPVGFPPPDVGSYEAVGLDGDVCFDRFSRLRPYGMGAQGVADLSSDSATRDRGYMSRVNWGELQNKCLDQNGRRYKSGRAPEMRPGTEMPVLSAADLAWFEGKKAAERNSKGTRAPARTSSQSRTAILVRTWDNYEYQENDLHAIRSLITEASLLSGGEYQVFLFINVKRSDDRDSEVPIWDNDDAYQYILEKIPEEFRNIAILWNEDVCRQWYAPVGEHSVYFQQFMPVQWFSKTHPEFDYIWNWEMDARYIGQHYHFLEQIRSFSRKQPRKYLWERNSRYYFPQAHGSYENFTRATNEIAENSPHIHAVWGPQPWTPEQIPLGPEPPRSEAKDDFEWGVGEEADFVTLLPMWDPRETWWAYHDKLWGYSNEHATSQDRQFPRVPRRVFINTLVRFSAQLLHAMHLENLAGRSMASEMWPGSVALQHGFKAVYAPHPIWMSHQWPKDYLDLVFNAEGWGAGSLPGGGIDDGRGVGYDSEREARGQKQIGVGPNGEGRLGRWAQERDSPYNPDREHNFAGWSWYFWSDFPKVLYWRWLGWKARFQIVTIDGAFDNDGGAEEGGPEVSLSVLACESSQADKLTLWITV